MLGTAPGTTSIDPNIDTGQLKSNEVSKGTGWFDLVNPFYYMGYTDPENEKSEILKGRISTLEEGSEETETSIEEQDGVSLASENIDDESPTQETTGKLPENDREILEPRLNGSCKGDLIGQSPETLRTADAVREEAEKAADAAREKAANAAWEKYKKIDAATNKKIDAATDKKILKHSELRASKLDQSQKRNTARKTTWKVIRIVAETFLCIALGAILTVAAVIGLPAAAVVLAYKREFKASGVALAVLLASPLFFLLLPALNGAFRWLNDTGVLENIPKSSHLFGSVDNLITGLGNSNFINVT